MFVIAIPREEIAMPSEKNTCPCQDCVYQRATRRIGVDTFPVKIAIHAEPISMRRGFAGAAISVRDREDGTKSELRTMIPIVASGESTTEAEVIASLRQAVENTLLHELDECWRVDGGRPRDPHVGVQASCRACLTIYKVDDEVERHRHGHQG